MHSENPPRILRTLVFRSGVDEESILEEAGNGMDALCLDLEDSTPKDRLREARETFRGIARKLTDMGVMVMARVNTIEDGAEEDLEAIICRELHCIESLYLRSKIIIEARVAGVPFPIGGGPTAIKTVEALREFAIQNKKLGYDGFYTPGLKYWPNSKEAVAAANEVFTPTKEDVSAWLQRYPNLEHPRMRERVDLARRLGVV
jgi:citrate lyase beta subunit